MPTLHVCPLSRVPETVTATGASHLVTLVTAGTVLERPHTITAERHLLMELSDIATPRSGHVLPAAAHVERLLAFVRSWDRERPLLIHCYAGVSRSTAAAYVTACALAPAVCERSLADELRRASPTATPNRLLVKLADDLLGRQGRMVDAIAAIGRGADAFEGAPFQLPLPSSASDQPARGTG